jgi:succinate-acetate transporter protein
MPDDKDEHSVSMVPFGLTVLSIATFLMGFAAIFQSRTTWAPYFTMALLFGGVGELLAGMWAFAYREPIVATVFSFLGLFYAWFGLTNLIFLGGTAEKMAEVSAVSMGMVFLVGGLTTLYLWIASFREPPGFNLTLLFLWIAFVLLAVSLFTELAIVSTVGGIAAIISSVIAATASFADLHKRAGLGEVLMVDQLARKARERLAEKIRPSEPPRPPESS